MDIANIAKKRYTAKTYDPKRKIPPELFEQLCDVLRLSPSSLNAQPWYFMVVHSEQAKVKILDSFIEFNHPRVRDASHIVVFCTQAHLDEAYWQNLLAVEEHDGRFVDQQAKQQQEAGRRHFVKLKSHNPQDFMAWRTNQVHIAFGALLLAAGCLGIDATPIGGFDHAKLDAALGLAEKGLNSVVVASLGYHGDDDFNLKLPKSRLPKEQLFEFI